MADGQWLMADDPGVDEMRESRFISHRPQGEAISHQPSGVWFMEELSSFAAQFL